MPLRLTREKPPEPTKEIVHDANDVMSCFPEAKKDRWVPGPGELMKTDRNEAKYKRKGEG